MLRFVVGGKRREMGLGGFPDVTLAGARDAVRAARAKVKAGADPIEDGRVACGAARAVTLAAITFEESALRYIKAHEPGWRHPKHAAQWRSTLATYAFPLIGGMLVRDGELRQVLAALEPPWREKTETASRLCGRIEAVLDRATGREYRSGPNPERWKGGLATCLPAPGKVAKVEHHAAAARRGGRVHASAAGTGRNGRTRA